MNCFLWKKLPVECVDWVNLGAIRRSLNGSDFPAGISLS